LSKESYRLREAEPRHYAFAMHCMEESVLASVSEEEASDAERWMDAYRQLVSMHFEGAGMPNSLYVLEHLEEPVGMLWMGIGKDQFTGDDTGYVLGIQVSESHRGRGLGKEMLRWAEAWCRSKGVGSMSINVSPRNRWALRLYEDYGFQTHSLVMRRRLR